MLPVNREEEGRMERGRERDGEGGHEDKGQE